MYVAYVERRALECLCMCGRLMQVYACILTIVHACALTLAVQSQAFVFLHNCTAMSSLKPDRQPDSLRYDYGPSPQIEDVALLPASMCETTLLDDTSTVLASPQASPGGESPLAAAVNLTPSILAMHRDQDGATANEASAAGATPIAFPVVHTPKSAARSIALASLAPSSESVPIESPLTADTPDDKLWALMEAELFGKASAKAEAAPSDEHPPSDSGQQQALKEEVNFWSQAVAEEGKVRSLGGVCVIFLFK